jgi:hypothetical protein
VIAAIVDTIIEATVGETIWVVAQSNIAVKNIAEKLYSCDFKNFRLLVSGDFINDWWVEYPLIAVFDLITIQA